MAGFNIVDTHTTITDTPDAITASVDGVRPAAGVTADLVAATKNVPIRVVVLRAAGTDAVTGDTYSVHRVAIGGGVSTTNALSLNQPIDAGESHSYDNLVVNPGYKLVVVSAGGRVSFSADYGEEP